MRRAVLLSLFVLGCRIPSEPRVDTVLVTRVDSVGVARTDTLLIVHVDTLTRERTDTLYRIRVDTVYHLRVDTLVRIDTLVSPPAHDTTFLRRTDTVTVTRVDTLTRLVHDTTIVQRTDTLFLPGRVVHDSTWVYVQGNPTNPFGGGVGDPRAGIAYIPIYEGFAIVFWRGLFVGVVRANNGGTWDAYLYSPADARMPWRGTFPTLLEAIQALVPITITVDRGGLEPGALAVRRRGAEPRFHLGRRDRAQLLDPPIGLA